MYSYFCIVICGIVRGLSRYQPLKPIAPIIAPSFPSSGIYQLGRGVEDSSPIVPGISR